MVRDKFRRVHRDMQHAPYSQRRAALVMVYTGVARVVLWVVVTVLFVAGQATVVSWFGSVKFVALLSILALVLTDWGQVAASLAQLTASGAHAAARDTRATLQLDMVQLDGDVGRLAELQPGPEAKALATEICERLPRVP